MKLQVIENYLDKKLHEKIQGLFLANDFAWYYVSPTATYFDEDGQDTGVPKDDNFMFVHCFLQEFGGEGSTEVPEVPQTVISPHMDEYMKPVLFQMQQTFAFPNPIGVLRIKANMYMGASDLSVHNEHTDYPYSHKGSILYLDNSNGYTVIDSQKVDSKENRVVFFDPSIPHASTNCSDSKYRTTINLNYL